MQFCPFHGSSRSEACDLSFRTEEHLLLLVGNSPNRIGGGDSWHTVLDQLNGRSSRFTLADQPLPLAYEAILGLKRRKEHAIKTTLANGMRILAPNWVHERLVAFDTVNILTTNYDYTLEAAIGGKQKSANLAPESGYSAFRRRSASGRYVWHIHGECNAPRTLMLGYHHYAGYLEKVRKYVVTPDRSPFMRGDVDFDQKSGPYSWVDLFLREESLIFGLGLEYVELVLWWLLIYKARLRRDRKDLTIGRTIIFSFGHGSVAAERSRLDLLTTLGAQVVRTTVRGDDWERAHERALEEVEEAVLKARRRR